MILEMGKIYNLLDPGAVRILLHLDWDWETHGNSAILASREMLKEKMWNPANSLISNHIFFDLIDSPSRYMLSEIKWKQLFMQC